MTPYPYGKSNSNNSRFTIRNHGGQKKRHNIFQVLKEKNCQPRILFPVKIFKSEGEIKILRCRRTKKMCHPEMAKGRSLNRKKTMKEETMLGTY